MHHLLSTRIFLGAGALLLAAASHAADPLAPAGAKGVLSVEYLYESAGRERSEGMYDPHEWRVKRTVSVQASMAALAPTAMPMLQPLDAAQTGQLKEQTRKAQGAAAKMAPITADVGQIMARCGENEACITREIQKLGMGLHGTPQMAAATSAKKDAEELSKPGAMRYQYWQPTLQTGRYQIDETTYISSPDPICARLPRKRCTRNETRVGTGQLPVPQVAKKDQADMAAGPSAMEVDTGKSTITLRLPAPILPLPYTETITTDEPEGTHDTPTPKGPRQKLHQFRLSEKGGLQTFTVPLAGGWRNQSGQQVVALKGKFGDGGKLTIRWNFKAQ